MFGLQARPSKRNLTGERHELRFRGPWPAPVRGFALCNRTAAFNVCVVNPIQPLSALVLTSIIRRQWSLGPHSSTPFIARTDTFSWKPRDANA